MGGISDQHDAPSAPFGLIGLTAAAELVVAWPRTLQRRV